MNEIEHVFDFLAPVHAPFAVASAVKHLLDVATQDPAIGKAIIIFAEKYAGRPVVSEESERIFQRLHRAAHLALNMPDIPDFVQPLLAVGYLRAKADLQSSAVERGIHRIGAAEIKKATEILPPPESNFFWELLVETSIRAIQDRSFADRLQGAAEEINQSFPPLSEPAAAIFRKSGGGDGGPLCVACGPNGDCRTIPCWVIIVVIIVIVTTK